jgi:hypothetical protein
MDAKKKAPSPEMKMQAAPVARPVRMAPLASVHPGTAHGLSVTLVGGSSVHHPGDVLTAHFNFQTDEETGFPPIGGDLWRYLALYPVYIHDKSVGTESMGAWNYLSYEVTALDDDGRGGTFRVTIPSDLAEGNTYVVTVIRNGDAYGHSVQFPVWPAGAEDRSIEVVTPNGGEVWPRGTEKTVVWRTFSLDTGGGGMGFLPTSRFTIDLVRGDAAVAHFGTAGMSCEEADNTCSFSWMIPAGTGASRSYKVRVRHADEVSLGGGPLGDDSDGAFEITAPSIVFESPTRGQRVPVFGTFPIRATITGITEGLIDVRLLHYGALVKEWGTPLPEDGHLVFNRSSGSPLASDCGERGFEEVFRGGSAGSFSIRLQHRDWPTIAAESPDFVIERPSIRLTSPSG